MKSSHFMDKQIMDLSKSQNNDFDLLNSQDEHSAGEKKEEILPSYDFQQIRSVGASQSINLDGSNVGGARVWNPADSEVNTSDVRNYGSLDFDESAKVSRDKIHNSYDAAIVSEIDKTMKKHVDDLLNALEGLGARVSQLESRTRHLESSMDDVKISVRNDHGSTDDKLRQMENILREVQTGLRFLQEKGEITEAHIQFAKLQTSKGNQQSENQNSVPHFDSMHQAASSLQQPQYPQSASLQQSPQPLPSLPHAPSLPPSQNPSSLQLPTQLPPSQPASIPQREPYFPPTDQPSEAPYQRFQAPPPQQPQLLPQAPRPQFQPAPQLSHYPQPQQKPQPPSSHYPEEMPYIQAQNYPPSMTQQPSGAPPSQPSYGHIPKMYEPQSSKSSSGYPQGYGPPTGSDFSDSYPYPGSPSRYSNSSMKPPQVSSTLAPNGGSGYPRLPTAQILPLALPTATSVSSGSSSGGTGNKVPIDDVVDRVTKMGFSRDQVRATVRKLTENGQSVDLNVVLDKLMNGEEVQPPKGWFGR